MVSRWVLLHVQSCSEFGKAGVGVVPRWRGSAFWAVRVGQLSGGASAPAASIPLPAAVGFRHVQTTNGWSVLATVNRAEGSGKGLN